MNEWVILVILKIIPDGKQIFQVTFTCVQTHQAPCCKPSAVTAGKMHSLQVIWLSDARCVKYFLISPRFRAAREQNTSPPFCLCWWCSLSNGNLLTGHLAQTYQVSVTSGTILWAWVKWRIRWKSCFWNWVFCSWGAQDTNVTGLTCTLQK